MDDKRLRRDSWMEKRPFPGGRLQPLVSGLLLVVSLATFVLFSTGDVVVQVLLLVVFASLSFAVGIFPQYSEFTGLSGALVREGAAKAKPGRGMGRYFPFIALLVVLIAAPLLVLFITPQFFLGVLVGVIAGFSGFQLAFTAYVRNWEGEKGLSVSRYALVAEDDRGRQIVLEYGLKAERR